MSLEIIVRRGDLTEEKVDAIVNPANSQGVMGGGVAWAIKQAGGVEVEKEAIEHAPIKVGEAVATSAGNLPARFVIHAPTMELPAQRINADNVKKATYAALNCAIDLGVKSIAFPGMGTGVGGVGKAKSAAVMVDTIKGFPDSGGFDLDSIVLVGFDDELTEAFKEALEDAGI